MFLQFKKINNESGVVLFIVLMVAIIVMIFSVGILTQSQNETNYAQQQVDQIVSDQLAKGIFWNAYSTGKPMTGGNQTLNIEGRNYEINMTNAVVNSTANSYTVTINYDTFQ